MKRVFAETFKGGVATASVESITLVNNTAKTDDSTVPDGYYWILQSITAKNPDSVQRTITIKIYTTAAKTQMVAMLCAAATPAGSWVTVPNQVTAVATLLNFHDLVLPPGYTIETVWATGGASAGGTAADGLVTFVRALEIT